ncbi:amidase signature domain-containing protein [Xylariaceae sp. FL0594]|nr:amidase signature domain-containing protein [Xylariaceae sp. FL0594]
MLLDLQPLPGSEGGHLFSVAGKTYLAPIASSPLIVPSLRDVGLITVFSLPEETPAKVSSDWVRSKVREYIDNDDVFSPSFLKTVVFCGAEEDGAEMSADAHTYLTHLGNERVVFLSEPALLPGPYCCWGEELRDVWKLVDDVNGTCMATLKPQATPSGEFEVFSIKSPGSQFNSFALPSRIKARKATNSPFAGFRVVIKDNIDLRGVKTSVGNKAFYEAYPRKEASASCVQRIIDLGMVIVGKTKMNSFGNWEEPLEYIDYQCPWNPRGDGYQSPGGSSSGSAAAIASYDWLDIAIGTDTWGSVTRPSLWCGCFGLRPTWGALPSDGIEPFCQAWDTAGVLARDLQRCRDFSGAWLSPEKLEKDPQPFSSIIWPTDFWSVIDSSQIEIAKDFVEKIKATLDIECHELSFAAAWKESPPSEAQDQTLADYINEAAGAQCYDAYHHCDDFRARYWELYSRAPYVSPPNQRMWSYAKNISREERDRDFAKIEVYRQWLTESVFTGKASNALVMMPLESMTTRYRDEVPDFRRPPQDGVNALAIAPVLNAPLLSVPIAELPYHSRITDKEETLPLVVALMSPKGTDLTLMDEVLKVLERWNMPTAVKTGSSMYN